MEQLSGKDAGLLYRETNSAPLHLSTLQIFDQSDVPGGRVTFKEILSHVEGRLHLFRRARQKVAHVPLDLDLPYWIEDSEFDCEFHVRHIALPEPGDWRQLCIQVARLHSRPLDTARPLWEMYVIEGLNNVQGVPKGSFAVLTKIHASALGTITGRKDVPVRPLSDAILDDTDQPAVLVPNEGWKPERMPANLQMLTRAWLNSVKQPFKVARVFSETVPDIVRLASRIRSFGLGTPRQVPRTRFNVHVSPHRAVDAAAFDLNVLSEIRSVVTGATVNDVVLSIIGGAVRKYLRAKSELPGDPLVALAPVSIEHPRKRVDVTQMNVTMASNIEDALERLETIRDATQASGALDGAVGAALLTDWNEHAPAMTAALGARLYTGLGVVNRVNPFFNCTVTNVPGPQHALYLCGARLVAKHGIGAVLDGAGANFSALSYNGELTITLTADRRMVPDPAYFADCLEHAYADLVRASEGRRKRRKSVA